ncbi:hypothetical protein [Sphingomonas sp.]|uniref:hypothetical protein n=1 Tax=Sphingomonas sp. TaxID=28214 RepID=UPI0035C7DF9A
MRQIESAIVATAISAFSSSGAIGIAAAWSCDPATDDGFRAVLGWGRRDAHRVRVEDARRTVNGLENICSSLGVRRDQAVRTTFPSAASGAYRFSERETKMAENANKWRREQAVRRLAAPVANRRTTGTLTGKVEECFDEIMAARRRGMSWRQIAEALSGEDQPNPESVESAFRRICDERGVAPPMRRRKAKNIMEQGAVTPVARELGKPIKPQPVQQDGLFGHERWVDEGDD